MSNNTPILIFTDGAASGNPGPGGYGIVMRYGTYEKEFSQGFRKTTNNRMELLAVIVALNKIKNPGHNVLIYTDSKYVVDSVEKKWLDGWVKKGFKGKKNPDLWREYLKVAPKHNVKFKWIKGHAGHPENERCDALAVEGSQNPTNVDVNYEKENIG
ncbi:MAG: ribonuclease HI [Bacteroidia bacterium]